jgi:hypothetical protein
MSNAVVSQLIRYELAWDQIYCPTKDVNPPLCQQTFNITSFGGFYFRALG